LNGFHPEAPMFYFGLDIHSTRIAICVLSETGHVTRRSQVRGVAPASSSALTTCSTTQTAWPRPHRPHVGASAGRAAPASSNTVAGPSLVIDANCIRNALVHPTLRPQSNRPTDCRGCPGHQPLGRESCWLHAG